MNEEDRLRELFSLAQKTNQHGSLGRRLDAVEAVRERDLSAVTNSLKTTESQQNLNQDKLNYTYGL